MGGEKDLVMFLSGMGGTEKSEVIKAFVEFVRGISMIFGWNYNTDVVKITARTMPNFKWEDTSQYSLSILYKDWGKKHRIMEINKGYSY